MDQDKRFWIVFSYLAAFIVAGLLWPMEESIIVSYKDILFTPGVLITDYFLIGSVSAGLINAGIVGLGGLLLIHFTQTKLSGPTIAGVFTMAGFALFGKTPFNIWPIMLGVAFGAWIKKEKFRNYIVVALFGTALGPVVTTISYGLGLGYGVGALVGIVIGIFLPSLASHVLHNHQGFNLYNIGFTCGIMGMYVTAKLKVLGHEPGLELFWGREHHNALAIFFLLYFLSMVIVGWRGRNSVAKLWRLPGTLVTDFVVEQGLYPSLLNMGLVGIMGSSYILMVGGDFNGPTIGGLLTIVGFGAFGKHVRNIWPVMLGVYLATHLSVWEASEPGPLLAALFGTTLAPIAGGFGPVIGALAGVLHLAVVMHVGPFHAGMNLYNNGFAGGLVATLFIGASRWFGFGPRGN